MYSHLEFIQNEIEQIKNKSEELFISDDGYLTIKRNVSVLRDRIRKLVRVSKKNKETHITESLVGIRENSSGNLNAMTMKTVLSETIIECIKILKHINGKLTR